MGIYMAGKVSELLKEKWVLYLTTFFNKNMIVVSLCAMIFTNLLVSIRHHEDNRYYQYIYREGLKNKNSKDSKDRKHSKHSKDSKAKSKDSSEPEPELEPEPDEAASLSETNKGNSDDGTEDADD